MESDSKNRKAGGFDEKNFSKLYSSEESSFWFVARNELILSIIRKNFSDFTSFHEIGCGTGFVLSAIHHTYPNKMISGSELFEEGLIFAKKRLPNVRLVQMDAMNQCNDNQFDLVGAFDVLEHIADDELVLENIYHMTKSGVILTVPQHMFLWSDTDEIAHHVRRYSQNELKNKLISAGFDVKYMTGFVSLLFPFMYVSRLFPKKGKAECELNVPLWLNTLFYLMMKIEFIILKLGIKFPFGGSILVVATKK